MVYIFASLTGLLLGACAGYCAVSVSKISKYIDTKCEKIKAMHMTFVNLLWKILLPPLSFIIFVFAPIKLFLSVSSETAHGREALILYFVFFSISFIAYIYYRSKLISK